MIFKKKEPEPIIEVDTLDQKLLYNILAEEREQSDKLGSISNAVWIIAGIMILGFLASCFIALFGPSVLF